ncbi:MAG: hypothetical protein IJJ35_08065 [Exiguobacterium sp.]|uniref:hypothetical protein n=1 Tax=Exiguobacterium sp. TaxID=44751 RepID=UPI0025795363|nr:hypothetical protein [Exiguobacterium sp.]MBQ6459536.1 hypothetical protein [Exiguobacterium sp.]MBR2077211.1 hypothetical protein [Exiguobacterium sp.]
MDTQKKVPFDLLPGGKTKDKMHFRKSAFNSNYGIDVSNVNFSTNLFDQETPELSFGDLRKEDEQVMSEYVSKRELDLFKELIANNRQHDEKLNEEKILRLEEKVAAGNQLILERIESSNVQVVSTVESLNRDVEHRFDSLKLNFEQELDRRFAKERDASAAEAKSTRRWLWTLAIPSIIGIVQIIQNI